MTRVCGYRESKSKRAKQPFDFESGSIETLCHLVEKGHGYTVVPHLARTWNATRAGKVIPFSDPRPGREVSLVVHQSFAREGLLGALLQSIAGSLPPELRNPDTALKTIKLR
jgi:LysR family hydrogen peroxide-inducible transcriptional activator